MIIRIGNLQLGTTEEDLRVAFEPFGQVDKSIIGCDRITKISRDFGFVEMTNQMEGHAAIAGMSSKEIKGNQVTVKEVLQKIAPKTSSQS